MTGSRALVPGARLAIGLAVRVLPTRADRDRYYCEFVAELHGLPASAQLRHAVGYLSQAFTLRAALHDARPPVEEVPMSSFGRRFRCRVLRMHDWRVRSAEDGGRYRDCSVCGRDDPGRMGPGHAIGV
jgi:hypothetical protein